MKTNKKGFTLVELVIVIAVIAILAAVLLPTFSGIITRARMSSALQRATSVKEEVLGQYFTTGEDLYGLTIYVHTAAQDYKFEVGAKNTDNEGKLVAVEMGENEEIPATNGAAFDADSTEATNGLTATGATKVALYRAYGDDVTVVIPAGSVFGLNADTSDLHIAA